MKRLLPVTVLVTGIAIFLMSLHGTPQAGASAQGDDPAQVEAGQAVYESTCADCHGIDGTGGGLGRDLTGVATEADRAQHIASVTEGLGIMPAHADLLSAEEIEQAVSYVRLTFVADDGASEDDGASADDESTETGEEDSAAEDEAATTEDAAADEDLASTGVNTGIVAVIGATLLAGGAQLVLWSRRSLAD